MSASVIVPAGFNELSMDEAIKVDGGAIPIGVWIGLGIVSGAAGVATGAWWFWSNQ